MKKLFTFIALLFAGAAQTQAQGVFWTENFTGGSTGLQVGSFSSTNGAWSMSITGSEGADPNPWYVSCQEAGQLPGVCGAVCATGDLGGTLHIGAAAGIGGGDGGASYDAGGLCGIITCPATDRRAQSPTINCTGKYNIRMKFYYILNGQGTTDDGNVYYSSDNGASWSLLLHPPKTTTCPSTQGRWDTISVALPASANNNPNVKVGFGWVNNDDGVGTDPSFAVDSVSLRTPAAISASMTVTATTVCEDSCLTFTNTSTGSVDSFRFVCAGATIASPGVSPCSVCFPNPGSYTVKLYLYNGGVKVDSASSAITVNPAPHPVITKSGSTLSVPSVYTAYQWYTVALPPTPIAGATNSTYTFGTGGMYAIIVDSGGCKGYAIINTLGVHNVTGADNIYWLAQENPNGITLRTAFPLHERVDIAICDAAGRAVLTEGWEKGSTSKQIADVPVPQGIYIIRLSNSNTSAVLRWVKH